MHSFRHTPTFFVNVLRLIVGRPEFTQVKPHPNHCGWNAWCFACPQRP
jgi:hypothetical protein